MDSDPVDQGGGSKKKPRNRKNKSGVSNSKSWRPVNNEQLNFVESEHHRAASSQSAAHSQHWDSMQHNEPGLMNEVDDGYGAPPMALFQENGQYRAQPDISVEAVLNRTLNPQAQPFVPRNLPSVAASATQQPAVAQKPKSNKGPSRNQRHSRAVLQPNADSFENLRERLVEELEQEKYECMICYQHVMRYHWVWSCTNCHHIFHFHNRIELSCLTKWIRKSKEDDPSYAGWRCPGCQNVNERVPNEYYCFCGKQRRPQARRGECTPHCCSDTCGKQRGNGCTHPCTLPCHPGPCPPCPRTVRIVCDCGKNSNQLRCGTVQSYQCDSVCGRPLSCGVHECAKACHNGPCADCAVPVQQQCHCGQDTRSVRCTAQCNPEHVTSYSCARPCTKLYDCGIHTCERTCHEGPCGLCTRDPKVVTHCPCGKSALEDLSSEGVREKCSDRVPECGLECGKRLPCAHLCKEQCHAGPCAPCDRVSHVKCRCGASSEPVPCAVLDQYDASNPVVCGRRCKRSRSCKQHKCNQTCCVDEEHLCLQLCGKRLACALHTCDRLCHVGRCPPCLQAVFEDVSCTCGLTVREPPVPCGQGVPVCAHPCSRAHSCEHPVTHNCHAESECPPCTTLTRKWCHGHHELRSNIPCHLSSVSCGGQCGAELPCHRHVCTRVCHPAPCAQVCEQKCTNTRALCGHPCAQPCHDPDTEPCFTQPCKAVLSITCKCGRQVERASCAEVERRWNVNFATMQQQIQQQSQTGSVSILNRANSHDKTKCVPCDSDCQREQRNRTLASALSLDLAASSTDASYTEFLRAQVKQQPAFIRQLEQNFQTLIVDMESLKQARRCHSFTPMDRDRRRAIHELATYYQIDTISYDAEPQRNIIATAHRGKSQLPNPLLSSLLVDKSTAFAKDRSNETGMMALQPTTKPQRRSPPLF